METKCGLDFEKKLSKLKTYERFDYIRKYLMRKIKENGGVADSLSTSAVRAAMIEKLKITSKIFTQMQSNLKLNDEAIEALAEIIGEDKEILIEGTPYQVENGEEKEQEDHSKNESSRKKSRYITKETKEESPNHSFILKNHTTLDISILVEDDIVNIYENHEAPPKSKLVVLARRDYFIGGNDARKVFSERVYHK